MPEEHGIAYRELRERVSALVRDASPGALDVSSAATPEWRVHDVLAHMVGVTNDIVNGRMEGIASDAWTQAQVDPRGAVSLDELLAEWDEFGPHFEAMLTAAPAEISGQALFDAGTHEHDIRHALGEPGARDSDAVAIGYSWSIGVRTRNEAPAICFVTEYESATAGAGKTIATVEATRFEFFRAFAGRRTVEEIEHYGWEPDAHPELLLVASFFAMRTSSLGE